MSRASLRRRVSSSAPGQDGYAMAALLVAMSVMAVTMSVALPVWTTAARREKEAELIFRGEQYARAIAFFQRESGGAFPPTLDVLVDRKFLRKAYKDPITGGDFETLAPGSVVAGSSTPGGLAGASTGGRTGGRATTGNTGGRGGTGTTTGRGGQTGGRATGSTLSTRTTTLGLQAGASLGIMGVRSKSADQSLRIYKDAERYNEWLFLATEATNAAGQTVGTDAPTGAPGGLGGRADGRGGREGGRGGRDGGRGARDGGRGGRGGRDGGRGVDGGGRGGRQSPFGGGGTSPFGGGGNRGRGF